VIDPADTSGWVPLPSDYFTPRTLLAAAFWNLATPHASSTWRSLPPASPLAMPSSRPEQPAELRGTTLVVPVAALADIHESKRRADRPKDRAYLESADPLP
jgi:hypothetical protein